MKFPPRRVSTLSRTIVRQVPEEVRGVPPEARGAAIGAVEALESRRLLHGGLDLTFDFRPAGDFRPGHDAAVVTDVGEPLRVHAGHGAGGHSGGHGHDGGEGLRFGWVRDGRPWRNGWTGGDGFDAAVSDDPTPGGYAFMGWTGGLQWQLELPDGRYDVELTGGESGLSGGSRTVLAAQGQVILDHQSTSAQPWGSARGTVEVTDGVLRVTAPEAGSGAKLMGLRVVAEGMPFDDPDGPGGPATVPLGHEVVARVDFRPAGAPGAESFVADSGSAYGERAGGLVYGWTRGGEPSANERVVRHVGPFSREVVPDGRFRGVARTGWADDLAWEMALPDGEYKLRITAGDPTRPTGIFHYDAEGEQAIFHAAANRPSPFSTRLVDVAVRDGRLTITDGAPNAGNALAWVEVFRPEDSGNGGDNGGGGGDNGGNGGDNGGGGGDNGGGGGDNGGSDDDGRRGDVVLGPWQTVQPMSNGHMEGVAVEAGGKIYMFGGFTNEIPTPQSELYKSRTTAQVYDLANDSWSYISPLPLALTHFQGREYEGQIYLFGGFVSGPGSADAERVYRYDPATDTYTRMADMPEKMAGHGLAVVNGRVHLLAGYDLGTNQAFIRNNPHHFSASWESIAAGSPDWRSERAVPVLRDHVAATTVGEDIYLVGGQVASNELQGVRPDLWRFSTADGTWTRMADIPDGGRTHVDNAVRTIGGKILIFGGNTNGTFGDFMRNEVFIYDPASDAWDTLTTLPSVWRASHVVVLEDAVYVVGGDAGQGARPTVWKATLTLA